MKKPKTKEQIWNKWVNKKNLSWTESAMGAMDEYAEQCQDIVFELHDKPRRVLDPLMDLYRNENPRSDRKFYLPDTTEFYKWIVRKIIGIKIKKTKKIECGYDTCTKIGKANCHNCPANK